MPFFGLPEWGYGLSMRNRVSTRNLHINIPLIFWTWVSRGVFSGRVLTIIRHPDGTPCAGRLRPLTQRSLLKRRVSHMCVT